MAYGWMLLFAGGYRERIYGVCMICSSLCLFISFHFLCLDPLVGDGGFVAFFYIHPLEPLWRGWVPCGYFHFFSGFFLFRLPLVVRLHCLDGETSYFFVIIKKGTREFYAPNSSSSRIISGFFMTRSGFYFFYFCGFLSPISWPSPPPTWPVGWGLEQERGGSSIWNVAQPTCSVQSMYFAMLRVSGEEYERKTVQINGSATVYSVDVAVMISDVYPSALDWISWARCS